MQSNKRYVYILSFSLLYGVLIQIERVQTQVGKKSERECTKYPAIDTRMGYFRWIIGGTKVRKEDYPHMAALGFGPPKERTWQCGGTLISEYFVLTAAHCLRSKRTREDAQVVRLGAKNLQKPEPGYRDYDVSERIRHPGYKSSQRYDDIGLLRLSTKVDFSRNIQPACLQVKTDFDDSTLTATGWGDQGNLQQPSEDLLEVKLVVYAHNNCNSFYEDLWDVPDGIRPKSMICAGGTGGQLKDTCPGDSGGPLQIRQKKHYRVVGITSFGRTCGLANVPSIYTRVSNYIGWIEGIVWK